VAFPPPDALTRLLAELTHGLDARHIPFMLVGGQAVLLHDRPRLTNAPEGHKAMLAFVQGQYLLQ
jgi:hypothetical protein